MRTAHSNIEVVPLSEATGAEVRCGKLRHINDAAFREIHEAWLEHLVLVFRNQELTDAQFAAFARRFGPLKAAAVGPAAQASRDTSADTEIHVVSNVEENGVPIGILGHGEVVWHTDMSAFLQPPSASLLYALEIPPSGGDTFFNNMYLAYETLPDDLKRQLIHLTIKHETLMNSAGPGTGALHPIVSTHPETGCNALYLGGYSYTYVNELPRQESAKLLHLLWTHSTQPQFVWRHRWRPRDLVMWDNRCLMHYRQAFDPGSRRILHRTQVEGSVRPYTGPDALQRPPHSRGRLVAHCDDIIHRTLSEREVRS